MGIKEVAMVLILVGFLAGCIGGLSEIYGSKPPPDVPPPEEQLKTLEDIKALLVDMGEDTTDEVYALLEGKVSELGDAFKETAEYKAGKQATEGILKLLAFLGLGGGAIFGAWQRGKRQTADAKSSVVCNGLRFIESAISRAGDSGKVVTGNIKAEGRSVVAAVDKARALANE